MLNVERADDANSALLQRERVLPTLRVRRVSQVIVCQLVEHDDVGLCAQGCFIVEVLEVPVAHSNLARMHARKAGGGTFEIGASLRFDPADDDTFTVGGQTPRVLEQPAGLSRSGCARNVNHETRASADFAKELLGSRRAIHLNSLLRLRQGAPATLTETH